MRAILLAASLAFVVMTPKLGRTDEWTQVPSGAESSGEDGSSAGGDRQAVANFMTHVRSSRGDSGKMCELVAMLANAAAVLRDNGSTKESQLSTMDTSLNRSADQQHIARELMTPIQTVVDRQIAYVYAHASMSAEQIKVHWAGLCAAESGGR
jgi:hypothetical protein